MPARRRIPGSETDENFSVLIDDNTVDANEQKNDTVNSSQHYSGDSKKEFVTSLGQRFVGNNYSVAGFAIPNSFSQLSSSIGQFLQHQVIQTNGGEQPSAAAAPTASPHNFVSSNGNGDYDNDDDDDDFGLNRAPEINIMASRDRTGEFFNAIRSMQGRNVAKAVNIRDPRKATQMQSYSEFMMIAKHIGKNIASTYSKLEKLTICMLLLT